MARRNPDERRAELIAAIEQVVAERGFARTRVSDVAERAGVSVGLLHHYFGSLEEALAEAFAAESEACLADVGDRLARLPPSEALEVVLADLMPTTGTHWRLWIDAWGEALRSEPLRQTAERYTQRWREALARVLWDGVAQGAWRCDDPDDLAARVVACADGVALHLVLHPPAGGAGAGTRWIREILEAGVDRNPG